MHPVLNLPPIKLDASNALFCSKCNAVLAITYNGATIGLKGIRAVIEEESNCSGIPNSSAILTTQPRSRKKQRQLFEK